jgi:succinate dehydrogenase / fumarate reductase, membrane anchor subunit
MVAFMAVKRIVVGAHYGLRDWLLQRLTAIVMAIYTVIFLVSYVVANPQGYEGWHALFAQPFVKWSTVAAILSLCFHAWVGVRDIWMDYIKPTCLRLTFHTITAFVLIMYAIWAVMMMSGVK